MKIKTVLFISTILLILSACTTADEEVPSDSGADPSSTVPASHPSPSATAAKKSVPTADPDPAAVPSTQTQTPVPDSEEADTAPILSESGAPAQVDLSLVTSEPIANTDPQAAPNPGVPDPQTEIAHKVSQDLAERLGLDISELETVSVEDVEWPDSALGCPAPGMNYLMVITPGYKISITASGQAYTYHTDLNGNYVLCADDGLPSAQ